MGVHLCVTRVSFGLTWDYRCPFARLVHDHVVTGLRGGADWDVTFLPFCLGQAHVEEGDIDIWERPDDDSGLFALQLGVSLRDMQPGAFLGFHHDTYEHRFNGGGSLRDETILVRLITQNGGDADAAFADVRSGRTLQVVKEEHTRYVTSHQVWGTPTFIMGDKAVFVRLLDHSHGDTRIATDTVDRIIRDIEWPILNEFKHTTVPM